MHIDGYLLSNSAKDANSGQSSVMMNSIGNYGRSDRRHKPSIGWIRKRLSVNLSSTTWILVSRLTDNKRIVLFTTKSRYVLTKNLNDWDIIFSRRVLNENSKKTNVIMSLHLRLFINEAKLRIRIHRNAITAYGVNLYFVNDVQIRKFVDCVLSFNIS